MLNKIEMAGGDQELEGDAGPVARQMGEGVRADSAEGISFTIRVSGKPTYIPAPAPTPPANSVVPVISDQTPTVGQPLTATTGTWTGAPTPWFSYQWKVAGVDVPGATGTVFVPRAEDVGKTVTVQVIGFNKTGTVTVSSTATTAVSAT